MAPAGPPAVVLGLDSITGLQTARILARHGIGVVGVAEDRRHFACRSRMVDRVESGSPDTVAALLDRLVATLGDRFAVVPCADRWVSALVASRPHWPAQLRTVMPEAEVAMTLMDKGRFAEFAQANGIPIPPTVVIESVDSGLAAAGRLAFPVVVKPAIKPGGWDAIMGGKVTVVADPSGLATVLERGLQLADRLVAQEWVVGGEDRLISFNGYFDRHSRPLATFVARKLRQWPPSAGTSASGEEVRDDEVLEMAIELFQKAGFRGLAYLEVKRRESDGKAFVIEPNVGRPTGRSAIAEAGGVELVYSAYRDALDLPPVPVNQQTYRGVKWVYLRHDLQAALAGIRQGALTPRAWWESLRGPKAYAVWSSRDPVPFAVDIFHTARRRLRASVTDDLRGVASSAGARPSRGGA